MTDLFSKLNVLLRAGINDLLSGEGQRSENAPSKPRRVQPRQLGANIDREVAALRERVNDAVAYEDKLRAAVDAARAEVDRLDRQADEALEAGREEQARYFVEQMQRAHQRMTMTERDLSEHQLVTRELLTRVNEMDTWVEEAKRQQHEEAARKAEEAAAQQPVDSQAVQRAAANAPNTLSEVLRRAQETIGTMGDIIAASRENSAPVPPETSPAQPAESQAESQAGSQPEDRLAAPPKPGQPVMPAKPSSTVDDELEQRRQRLSKR